MGRSEPVSRVREKLLTTREASYLLGISEKDIIDLAEAKKIPHYKVAGEFLRFKKEEVAKLKSDIQKKFNLGKEEISLGERIKEFLYFNDFYILSGLLISFFLWVIFRG